MLPAIPRSAAGRVILIRACSKKKVHGSHLLNSSLYFDKLLTISRAWAVFCSAGQSLSARLLVLLGALSFYCSDVFVARDRFMQREMLNRTIGLPLYYAGQFLLAFSVGVVR